MTSDGSKSPISQDELASLLSQAAGAAAAPVATNPQAAADGASTAAQAASASGSSSAGAATQTQSPRSVANPESAALAGPDVEQLLRKAEQALQSIDAPEDPLPPNMKPYSFEQLNTSASPGQSASLDLLRDVELDLKIELGRTHMHLEDVLKLRNGAVVPLDKLAGDPVDIYVNGRLIARGEVLVLNDNFCVRVAELVAGESPSTP